MRHTDVAMSVAKKSLLDSGQVPPTLVMIPGNNQPFIMTPGSDRNLIPLILKKERPEAFTWDYEIWIRDSPSAPRREAIEGVGGSGISRVLIRQEYHRQDGKIVFDKTWIPSDSELAGHVFTQGMSDGVIGEIMGLWSVAPLGGRVFRAPMYGLEIWIPVGWRMAKENDARDGKPRPTFYRERDPHGAVRVSTMWRTIEKSANPVAEARVRADEGRKTMGVEGVEVEEKPNLAIVTWSQVVNVPENQPMRAHAWWIYNAAGLIFLTFTHVTSFNAVDLADEMASVREMVNRIARF